MPKLLLQFEDRVLKECAVSTTVTIGRLPDNTVTIDNQAVSSRHARIVRSGDDFVVEDLESRNGTFVNEKRVIRHTLRHGDVVLVGKHKLVFDSASGEEPEALDGALPSMPDLGGTMLLDTEHQRKLMAAVAAQLKNRVRGAEAAPTPKVGVLRVLAGQAERAEYDLTAHSSIIGKSDAALVRLKGWFKPRMAVAIARVGDGYIATVLRGRTLVNGERLTGRRGLDDGDLLQVGGLTLEFRFKSASV